MLRYAREMVRWAVIAWRSREPNVRSAGGAGRAACDHLVTPAAPLSRELAGCGYPRGYTGNDGFRFAPPHDASSATDHARFSDTVSSADEAHEWLG
jgi:hypothetical protein